MSPVIPKEEYESTILKASDLEDASTKTEIVLAEYSDLPQTGKTLVLTFKELDKSLPLNKTNIKKLVELFGDNTDDWRGQNIRLIKVLVNNPQTKQEIEGIRIREVGFEKEAKKKREPTA